MCNEINYNEIFLDEINFNIITLMWIYYYMTTKHLLFVILSLYAKLVLLYCVVLWFKVFAGLIDKKYR